MQQLRRDQGSGRDAAGPVRLTTVAPGVVVASEHLPWARAAALSATVVCGSVDEAPAQAGAAHLIEHLLFRGSSQFGPGAVDRLFDELGAEIQATTDRCTTQLATWVMAEDIPRASNAMSDVLWRPSLRSADVEHERQIVLEEVAMIEDAPEELAFELIGDALFPGSALGRPVIGRRDVIAGITRDALEDFHRSRYGVAPVVWVAVGHVDHDALCDLVARGLPDWRSPEAHAPSDRRRAPVDGAPQRLVVERASEQTHVAIAVPLMAARGPRRAGLQVLDALLGGPPSSRLFQEIRERRGLAYSVASFLELHHGFGAFGAYLGTRPERLEVALEVLGGELARVARGEISDEDLHWARRHVAGRLWLALETAAGRASLIAGRAAAGLPLIDPEVTAAQIEDVDRESLHILAEEILGDLRTAAIACVTPDVDAARGALDAAGLATGMAGATESPA